MQITAQTVGYRMLKLYNDNGVEIVFDEFFKSQNISTKKYDITIGDEGVVVDRVDINPLNKSDTKRFGLYSVNTNISLDSFCRVDANGNPTYCDEAMINNMVDRLAKLKAFA